MYFAEYNPLQRTFHIEFVSEKLEKSRKSLLEANSHEFFWVPIATGSFEECLKASEDFKKRLESVS